MQPPKPSLEDSLHMLIQSTAQFQQDTQRNLQATQASLQANTQAITMLEMQMGQLGNSFSEMEEEEYPNKSFVSLEDQFEVEASTLSKPNQ